MLLDEHKCCPRICPGFESEHFGISAEMQGDKRQPASCMFGCSRAQLLSFFDLLFIILPL
jgi:hypothetical protein